MQTRAWGLILDFVVAVIHLLFFGGTWHRSLLMWSIVTIPNEVLHFVLSSTSRPPGPTLVIRRHFPLFRSESRNEIYRFQISGGGRVRAAGGTRGGIAWPPLIPIWRSSSLPPSLCPPRPPLMCMFCPAKHLSAGMKLERKRFRAPCRHTKVFSGLTCLVLILASAYLLILICSHHICQHQYLKLNYRLGVAQNGGNDDYNQTSRSTTQRCLKLNTHTPLSPVFPSLWMKRIMAFLSPGKTISPLFDKPPYRLLSLTKNPEDGEALFRRLRKISASRIINCLVRSWEREEGCRENVWCLDQDESSQSKDREC